MQTDCPGQGGGTGGRVSDRYGSRRAAAQQGLQAMHELKAQKCRTPVLFGGGRQEPATGNSHFPGAFARSAAAAAAVPLDPPSAGLTFASGFARFSPPNRPLHGWKPGAQKEEA